MTIQTEQNCKMIEYQTMSHQENEQSNHALTQLSHENHKSSIIFVRRNYLLR